LNVELISTLMSGKDSEPDISIPKQAMAEYGKLQQRNDLGLDRRGWPFILLSIIVTESDSAENRFGPIPKRQPTTEPTGGNPEMGYLSPPIDRR